MSHDHNDHTVGPCHQGRFGLSLLNNLIGDYLERENNPLAIKMGFYHQAKRLSFDSPLPNQLDFPLSSRVVIFVHGLTNLENTWDFPPAGGSAKALLSHYIDVCFDSSLLSTAENYGSKLQQDFGFTPFYLRYNTGLPVAKNGRDFSNQISRLFSVYPTPIKELVLIGYGMGGNLLSHTQYWANKSGCAWPSALSKCVYLGNLNEGSLLALMLQFSSHLVRHLPFYYSHVLADWFDHRSAVIQQRSHMLSGPNSSATRQDRPAQFLSNSRHFFIGGENSRKEPSLLMRNPADLPVKPNRIAPNRAVPSSAPAHSQSAFVEGVSAFNLTHSGKVYWLIANWLTEQKVNATCEHAKTPAPVWHRPWQDSEIAYAPAPNRALIAGTVDLFASAYDKTIETIETMHYSIANEPFYALDNFPVINQITNPIEAIQQELLDALYRWLRKRGRMMHEFAAELAAGGGNPPKQQSALLPR